MVPFANREGLVGFFLSSEVVFGPLHVGYFKNVGLWLTDLWWSHHGAFFGPEYERDFLGCAHS